MDSFQQLRSVSTIGRVFIRVQGTQDNIVIAVIMGGLGSLSLATEQRHLLTWVQITHSAGIVKRVGEEDYKGKSLQDRLARLLDLGNGGLESVECCDVSEEAAAAGRSTGYNL